MFTRKHLLDNIDQTTGMYTTENKYYFLFKLVINVFLFFCNLRRKNITIKKKRGGETLWVSDLPGSISAIYVFEYMSCHLWYQLLYLKNEELQYINLKVSSSYKFLDINKAKIALFLQMLICHSGDNSNHSLKPFIEYQTFISHKHQRNEPDLISHAKQQSLRKENKTQSCKHWKIKIKCIMLGVMGTKRK